ncbi:predicted protein [Chaetoceros tenuissimus]|uniref:Uncharacterized protein n=1 Tax=Chaetoceros tenuissimus TaxID=426638 RepID=A0AAD3CF97_9STRA|nr:predicted protein [Chaetoceros tenuissimus]
MRRSVSSSVSLGYARSRVDNQNETWNVLPIELRSLCNCNASKLSDELVQLKEVSKRGLDNAKQETRDLKYQSECNGQRILSLQQEIEKVKKELEQSKQREVSAKKKNNKLATKYKHMQDVEKEKQEKINALKLHMLSEEEEGNESQDLTSLPPTKVVKRRSSLSYASSALDAIRSRRHSLSQANLKLLDTELCMKSHEQHLNSIGTDRTTVSTSPFGSGTVRDDNHFPLRASSESFSRNNSYGSNITDYTNEQYQPEKQVDEDIKRKNEEIEKLKMMILSRDRVIASMEESLAYNIKNMQQMIKAQEEVY